MFVGCVVQRLLWGEWAWYFLQVEQTQHRQVTKVLAWIQTRKSCLQGTHFIPQSCQDTLCNVLNTTSINTSLFTPSKSIGKVTAGICVYWKRARIFSQMSYLQDEPRSDSRFLKCSFSDLHHQIINFSFQKANYSVQQTKTCGFMRCVTTLCMAYLCTSARQV